jgi:GNAT superfamily N-acetyltransferase
VTTAGPQPAAVTTAREPRGGVRTLDVALVMAKVRRRFWSTRTAIAVIRDLDGKPVRPASGLQFEFIPSETFADLPRLLDASTGAEWLNVRGLERIRQAEAGAMSVARDASGNLLAFHFMHEAHDHPALEVVAPKMYPQLPPDEVLTEAVYCLPAQRGKRIAPALLSATGAYLAANGKRRVWAYLEVTNIAALRTFNRAGYSLAGEERIDRFRFGRFSTVFRRLSPGTRAEWEQALAGAQPDTL